jgi:MFS family permease
VTAVPLRRNRDFLLLQAGQLLSEAGTKSAAIAYPLLVLDLTGSAARAGVVAFARALALTLFALPAGVVADRGNRRWLMIAADGVRVLAVGGLAVALLAGRLSFWAIPLVALVEGAGAALFAAAQAGALRAVVATRQLPGAAGAQTGRLAAVELAGPTIGAALYGIARALPFLLDAVSYAFSTVSLLAMRGPFQASRDPDRSSLRSRLAEGFRFLWGHRFLRTCACLFGLVNFIGVGVLFAVVVLGQRQGLPPGRLGLFLSAFGGCVLLGSFLAPLVSRVLSVRAVLLLELWTWLGCGLFLVWPNVYVLAASTLPSALAIPSTNSVVHGYRMAITPDRLLGRVESIWRTISLLITPLGPLVAGILLDAVAARAAIGLFAAVALVLVVWGVLSPSIRAAPSLDELDRHRG